MNLGVKTEAMLSEANTRMGPYLTTAGVKAEALWVEIKRRNDLVNYTYFLASFCDLCLKKMVLRNACYRNNSLAM
jgi:hypothetical protein